MKKRDVLPDPPCGPTVYGIYINCNGPEFIDKILSGGKSYETRTRNMLRSLVGCRVALIETRSGRRPIVRGYATISGAETVQYEPTADCVLRRMQAHIYSTPYDIQPGGKKWFYKLADVTHCAPYPVPADHENHGRAWTCWARKD